MAADGASDRTDHIEPERVRAQIQRILCDPSFAGAPQLSRLLKHLVENALTGDHREVKEYSLGVELFGRGASFDSRVDNIVRSHARRLRQRLDAYFAGPGRADPIVIEIPKGHYLAVFRANDPIATRKTLRAKAALPVAAMAILGIAVAGLFLIDRQGQTRDVLPERMSLEPTAPSGNATVHPAAIAVLAFENLSSDREMEYLGEGLAEEILNRLAAVPSLLVTARTSAFSFKDKNATVQQIGAALGVAHVLEGSVRRSNDTLRVAVQLVDTSNGYRVWSETYDRKISDMFAIQDDIAQNVLAKLQVVLTPEQRSSLTGSAAASKTRDPEVFEIYLRGRHLARRFEIAPVNAGIQYLYDVINRDPTFTEAYLELSQALGSRAHMLTDKDIFENAERRRLIDAAIALEPMNANAHALLADAYSWSLDLEPAWRELEHAERLNPNAEFVLRYLGEFYMAFGWPPEKGIGYMQRRVQLDPLDPWARCGLAYAYYHSDSSELALQTIDRALELDPSMWVPLWIRQDVMIELKRYDEAIEASRRALEISGGHPADINAGMIVALAGAGRMDEASQLFQEMEDPARALKLRPAFRAVALAGLGRYEEAMDAVEYAFRVKDGFLVTYLDKGVMLPLSGNPRFEHIVKSLGMERRVERRRQLASVERS